MSAEWGVRIKLPERDLIWPCDDEASARRMLVRALNHNERAGAVVEVVSRDVTEWAVAEDFGPGCDCTDLCPMGPTCPGAILANLPGSGCVRAADRPATNGDDR